MLIMLRHLIRYPPDTPEKQQNLWAWLAANDPNAVAAKLPAFINSLKATYPSITKWGLIGVSFVMNMYTMGVLPNLSNRHI